MNWFLQNLLAKASHEAKPDASGGERNYLMMEGTLKSHSKGYKYREESIMWAIIIIYHNSHISEAYFQYGK